MTNEAMQELLDTSKRMVDATPTMRHRYIAEQIDWRDRLICIEGARGTGKSTLMRQRIKESFGVNGKAVYMSLDDLWFAANSLIEAVRWFDSHGYTHLFVDEVHQMPDWQLRIKNINDQFPALNVVYSGSSILKLAKGRGDLSRRQAVYELKGLSFREYLDFEGVLNMSAFKLEDVLTRHREIAGDIIGGMKVLPLFENYVRRGYYPFYKETFALYEQRIVEAVNKTLESDWPTVADVSASTVRKAKKMLMVLAASVPQQPNMSRLYRELETERNTGLKMLEALDKGALLALVPSGRATLKNLSRPEKIYCENTNLMYALTPRADIGTARETFLCSQLRTKHEVAYPEKGDFIVDDRYLLEVGGKGKGFSQIKDIPDSYVVVDDTELGLGNRIPLWLFGCLY